MGSVADRVAAVRDRVVRACADAGRDPDEVRLMAVTKTHPVPVLREAYAAGCTLLGENKVQEAVDKAGQLADLAELRWAFVGHLQTNKARQVAEFAAELHALDSLRLAEALDRRLEAAGRLLDVYLEVNSSGEDSKFGLPPAEVEDFATALRPYRCLRVRGLMTLAVNSPDTDRVRACFVRMQELQTCLRALDTAAGSYDELSMGMSGDFELAIAHGATTVRVGQALFGARALPA